MMTNSAIGLLLLLVVYNKAVAVEAASCASDFDCSLNGVCSAGVCTCDTPWVGQACDTMRYAVTPASGKNLWTGDSNFNTWNGPIVRDSEGLYHLYDPVYKHGSLWSVLYVAHGTSSSPTGPYDWSKEANISSTIINPAALVFPDATTGAPVYSLWVGGDIFTSSSADGPFAKSYKNPMGSNPAPAFYKGNFYLTDQRTTQVLTTSSLDSPWVIFGNISHPPDLPYVVEDPFLYVDTRGRFHVINHAYNTAQKVNCSASHVSSHFFSEDGKSNWGHSDAPYGHTVTFDDGTSQSYCTLERPNLLFDEAGFISHIHLAADLVTGNEGCGSTPCVNCKYNDHAGTLIVKLGSA
jgi:hypothetical protein